MYGYDFVHVLAAAITTARDDRSRGRPRRARAGRRRGANGDERGFNEISHEGVVDDDVYFAVIHDMTHTPVQDDPLLGRST